MASLNIRPNNHETSKSHERGLYGMDVDGAKTTRLVIKSLNNFICHGTRLQISVSLHAGNSLFNWNNGKRQEAEGCPNGGQESRTNAVVIMLMAEWNEPGWL